jgi:hypothetical protein
LVSSWPASHASPEWLRRIAQAAEVYLAANPARNGAAHLRDARRLARLAQRAIAASHDDGGAVMAALGALQAAWLAEISEGWPIIRAGAKSYRKAESANLRRSEQAQKQYSAWQRRAAEIRQKASRSMSNSEVAKKIDAARWRTVRKHI